MNCNHITKNNQPCKIRVSSNSTLHNGMRLCHIHLKNINNNTYTTNAVNTNIINNNTTNIVTVDNLDNVLFELNTSEKVRCKSYTVKGTRCTKKTNDSSQMCHIHKKQSETLNLNKEVNNVSENIVSFLKSPCINYKTNNISDNCYVCLDETTSKLSCGHFIHPNCLINVLTSNLRKNFKVFEHKNKYFVITNCLYCKQIAIINNIPLTDKLEKKYDAKKNKMKINNTTISFYFTELFLLYDTYETKEYPEKTEEEFLLDLKQLIFDNFSTIIFDNYIQQKKINIPLKYQKIEKNAIIDNIEKNIYNTLYSRYLYDKIKTRLELFMRIFECVVNKIIDMDNVQDDIINLVNIF